MFIRSCGLHFFYWNNQISQSQLCCLCFCWSLHQSLVLVLSSHWLMRLLSIVFGCDTNLKTAVWMWFVLCFEVQCASTESVIHVWKLNVINRVNKVNVWSCPSNVFLQTWIKFNSFKFQTKAGPIVAAIHETLWRSKCRYNRNKIN